MEIQIITKLKEFRSDVLVCCFIAYINVTKAGNIKSYLLYLWISVAIWKFNIEVN